MTESAAKSYKIWALTWGSRGDHEPAAALALGLADKGHSVKVFGCAGMRSFFDAYAVDFDALDRDVALHAANKKAREKLRNLAEPEGFTGDTKEEDYLFDSFLLGYEFINRLWLSFYDEGKHPFEMFFALLPHDKKMTDFMADETDVDGMPDWNASNLEFVAQQKGMTSEDYRPIARKRRDLFRCFLKRRAQELGAEPMDLMHKIHGQFSLRLVGMVREIGDDKLSQQREKINEELTAFFAWQEQQGDDLDAYLERYWADWRKKLGSLELPSGKPSMDVRVRAQNMALFYEALPSELRPDLVICIQGNFALGMSLKTKHPEIDMVPWWAIAPPRTPGDVAKCVGSVPTGGMELSEMLQGTRQLISLSASALKDLDATRQHITVCCTGKWILDDNRAQGNPDNSGVFGTALDKANLDAFLAASADDPPVYFGWGSMPHPKGRQALAELVVRALQLIDKCGIFVAGWSALEWSDLEEAIAKEYGGDAQQIKAAESRILFLTTVSHEFLFPKCACLVHHGGAGTSHAALRSGVPSIVAPVGFDQYDNANWIESMGCGMKVSHLADLDADVLAVALSEVLGDDAMKAKTKEVADLMAEERGVPAAVALIEKWLGEPAPEASAVEKGPQSWKDGVWDTYNEFIAETELSTHKISGNTVISHEGKPIGEMRGGTFAGDGGATYPVQVSVPVVHWFALGNVNEDGTVLTWNNGFSWKWVSADPDL